MLQAHAPLLCCSLHAFMLATHAHFWPLGLQINVKSLQPNKQNNRQENVNHENRKHKFVMFFDAGNFVPTRQTAQIHATHTRNDALRLHAFASLRAC